jgi:hypothetical protein
MGQWPRPEKMNDEQSAANKKSFAIIFHGVTEMADSDLAGQTVVCASPSSSARATTPPFDERKLFDHLIENLKETGTPKPSRSVIGLRKRVYRKLVCTAGFDAWPPNVSGNRSKCWAARCPARRAAGTRSAHAVKSVCRARAIGWEHPRGSRRQPHGQLLRMRSAKRDASGQPSAPICRAAPRALRLCPDPLHANLRISQICG